MDAEFPSYGNFIDMNTKDSLGWTPFMNACTKGHKDFYLLLVGDHKTTQARLRLPAASWTLEVIKQRIRLSSFLEFPANALKPKLWELAKAKAAEEPRYKVDDMIKEAGHDVLRLPPYHCDLNPIGILDKYLCGHKN